MVYRSVSFIAAFADFLGGRPSYEVATWKRGSVADGVALGGLIGVVGKAAGGTPAGFGLVFASGVFGGEVRQGDRPGVGVRHVLAQRAVPGSGAGGGVFVEEWEREGSVGGL